MEEELNKLHQEKMANEKKAKDEFDKRVKETKQKAIEENIAKAEKSGNKLTQTITEEGELIGVKETIDFESRDVADEEGRKKHEEEVMENAKEASAASISDEFSNESQKED
jgi:hypothetical protein